MACVQFYTVYADHIDLLNILTYSCMLTVHLPQLHISLHMIFEQLSRQGFRPRSFACKHGYLTTGLRLR